MMDNVVQFAAKTPASKLRVEIMTDDCVRKLRMQAAEEEAKAAIQRILRTSEAIIHLEWKRVASHAGGARAVEILCRELDKAQQWLAVERNESIAKLLSKSDEPIV